jgi:urea transporter
MPATPRSDPDDAFSLLTAFLSGSSAPEPRPGLRLPLRMGTAGTLLSTGLRSLGQVIFINNPVSGLLLLLALLLQSPAMGLLAALGVAAANLTARLIGADQGVRRNGIHGFNGALVGAAVAAFASLEAPGSLTGWLLLVVLGAALTTLVLESLGRWLVSRFGLPPLTLPFCLVTWLLLALAMALPATGLAFAPPAPAALAPTSLLLPLGVLRGFGQVFLCPSLATSALVLAAVAVASPLAALLGLAGGLSSSLTALAMGMDPLAVGQGLGSYNGVLCAIAIGGIFHALAPTSALMALLTAAGSSLLAPALSALLGAVGLPALTAPFVLATMAMLLVLRRALPSLLPVALHSVFTPEEHRRRYRVATALLADFRRRLGLALAGERRSELGAAQLQQLQQPELQRQLQSLFRQLDRDGNGWLSLEELGAGLRERQAELEAPVSSRRLALLGDALQQMDLDGDGRVDSAEFAALMLRLRRLAEGRERLLTYLSPVDGDSDDQLDPAEFDRLLMSVGQAPLQPAERQHLFGAEGTSLSWGGLVDRLLLT